MDTHDRARETCKQEGETKHKDTQTEEHRTKTQGEPNRKETKLIVNKLINVIRMTSKLTSKLKLQKLLFDNKCT